MLPPPNGATFSDCPGGSDAVTWFKHTVPPPSASVPITQRQSNGFMHDRNKWSELNSPTGPASHQSRRLGVEAASHPPAFMPPFPFPFLTIGSVPLPPPDVLLAALSYGRAATAMNTSNNINTAMHSCSAGCWSSATCYQNPIEKSSFADLWLRLLAQRSAFTSLQNYDMMKSLTQMHGNTPAASDRTPAGDTRVNEQQFSLDYSKMGCAAKNETEFDGKDTVKCSPSNPNPILDPHIQLRPIADSSDVRVICRQVIEPGHLFGPMPVDYTRLLDPSILARSARTMEAENTGNRASGILTAFPLTWMMCLPGTLNRPGEYASAQTISTQSQANLTPVFCTSEQLAAMYNNERAAPFPPSDGRQALICFKATKRIFPGEELIVEGYNPLNVRRAFNSCSSVKFNQSSSCSHEKSTLRSSVSGFNPLEHTMYKPPCDPSQSDAHVSTFIRRLFSIVTQNSNNNNNNMVPICQSMPEMLREASPPVSVPLSIGEALGHKINPNDNNPLAVWSYQTTARVPDAIHTGTKNPQQQQQQQQEQSCQPSRRNSKQNTFSSERHVTESTGNFCYDTGPNQLRAAHLMEPEEGGEGYSCEYCGKMFAYQYYRDKHLKYTRCVDQGNRKYPCKLCSRSFEKRDRLRIHVLHVHEKRRPHKCHLCEKSFSQSSSLNKHLRVHSGERPYKCCYCNKAFTASSILRTHIRQHSGEKPFKCKFCWKPFASHAAHDSHVRRTHAELVKPSSNAVTSEARDRVEQNNRTWTDVTWMGRGRVQDDFQPPTEVDASTSSNESIPFTNR